MRHLTALAELTLLVLPALVQAGWMRTYGGSSDDWGWEVHQTSDGGYIVAGFTTSFGTTKSDAWLLKTDEDGDTLWTRIWGGEDCDAILSIVQTSDGGYILTGQRDGSYEGDKGDLWLIKTDYQGDTLWTKVYGETKGDEGWCVCQTADGGYIIIGARDISIEGCRTGDIWLLRTDSCGDTLWTRTYGKTQGGQDTLQRGFHVNQISDGGFVLTGEWSFHLFLIRTDEKGDSLWSVHMKPSIYNSQGYWVEETSNGDLLVVGLAVKNDAMDTDVYLCKFNSSGDSLWAKTYGGSKVNIGNSFCKASDEGWVITGVRGWEASGWAGDLWIIKTDVVGDTVWTRTYGEQATTDWGYCVQRTSDGGYIVTGCTESFGAGGTDLWLIKTDSLGYVALEEKPLVNEIPDFEILRSIGSKIVLRYKDMPDGFHAQVFDVKGCKVDELHSVSQRGLLEWGKNQNPGVYFIRTTLRTSCETQKIILVR